MPIDLGLEIGLDVSIGDADGGEAEPSEDVAGPHVEDNATFRLLWKYTSAPICISINGAKSDFPMDEEITAPAYVEEVAMAVTGVIFEKVE